MTPQEAEKNTLRKSKAEKKRKPSIDVPVVNVKASGRVRAKNRTKSTRGRRFVNPMPLEVTVSLASEAFTLAMPTQVSSKVALKSIERMFEVLDLRKQALSEDNISKLVDIVLNDSERANVELDLEMDNAQLRADYLKSEKLLTSAQVRQRSGLSLKNKSEPASRWRRDRKLFSVAKKGMELFPAFQFRDGQPRPVIKKVLNILPSSFSPWQIAFWFASGNGWLDGEAPQDCLDAPNEVIDAAERTTEVTVG